MIVVTVELHSARTGETTLLHKVIVANDGTGDHLVGNYDVVVGRKSISVLSTIWAHGRRRGRVEGYRRQAYGVLNLVARALTACGYK